MILKTTPEMRARIRELTRKGNTDAYDQAVSMLLDDFEQSAITRSDPAVRDRVKPLKWLETKCDRGDGSTDLSGWEAEVGAFSVFYTIEIGVSDFSLARQDLDVSDLGNFADPAEAKAAAQAEYEQRIISALTSNQEGNDEAVR